MEDQLGAVTVPPLPFLNFKEAMPAWRAAALFVESTRGFLIADPIVTAKTPGQVSEWCGLMPELASKRVAVYYPRIQVASAVGTVWLSPSGSIAGVYARNDHDRGIWSAPADIRLDGAWAVEYSLTEAESAELIQPKNERPVNPIRNLFSRGILVWGARTQLMNDLDGRYINVVRTTEMTERSIRVGLARYQYESNTGTTWAFIKRDASNFLTELWKEGALVGSTAKSSFSVEIGLGSTMTGADILNGILILSVDAAITTPGEFTVMTFSQHQIQ